MEITSLVTGGAGFIGSHVVHHLIKQGHQVVVLDDLSGGFKANVNLAAKMHVGSITDTDLVKELFEKHRFTYVYHLAAYAAEGLSHFIRKFNYENNLIGSINLINAAVNYDVKCFVFTSSIAVYGNNTTPFIEALPPRPEDPYGIAKYAVELDLLNAQKLFGLNSIIFRPHNVYGPNQNIGDKYRNVVGIFMNQILHDLPLTIFGNGKQRRAFSYIDDVAPYIADSVNVSAAYNQIFNIGSDRVHSIYELAASVCKAMGTALKVQKMEKRVEAMHSTADHHLFEAVFKHKNYITIEDGLSKMAEWVKRHGSRSGKEFNSIEIKKNLPGFWSKSPL